SEAKVLRCAHCAHAGDKLQLTYARLLKGKKERMADLFAWLISFFLLIALLVLVTYQLMCLADLEFDYINPYDISSRINMVVLPEFITLTVLFCFYLLTGHWIMSLFISPCLFFNIRLYRQRRHLIDVTEIFNLLSWEKKHRLVKLFYLVFTLFLSVFWCGLFEKALLSVNFMDFIIMDVFINKFSPCCRMIYTSLDR
ncbi:Protein cornichon-like 4, partial [Mucuna pruriens]